VKLSSDRRRQIVPLAGVQIIGLLCGVVGVRWTSAVIPPDLLGWYGLLLSAVQCGIVVTHQGLIKHVQRAWSPATPGRPFSRTLVRASAMPTLWLGACMAAVLVVLHATGGVPMRPGIFAWLIVANLGVVAAVVLQTALLSEERYWANLGANAVSSVTRSFGPPLLVTLVGATLAVVSSAFLLHLALTVACGAWLLRGAWQRPSAPATEGKPELGSTLRAFAAAGLCGWIAAAASRWFAAGVLDADHVGYFVLAGNLAAVVPAALGGILVNYSFPRVFARARAGAAPRETLRETHRTVALVMIGSQAGLVALAFLAPWLIGLVIASRYAPATTWLLATGGAALAATTTQFYHNALLAQKRENDCVRLSVMSGLVRMAAMGGACLISAATFRTTLIAVPWLTVLLEAWYTNRHIGGPPRSG
jgi:hypothetical protein